MPTPRARSCANHAEEVLRVLLRERGRRLINDQNFGFSPQRAGDLDELLLRHGEIAGVSSVSIFAPTCASNSAARRWRSFQSTRPHSPASSRPRAMFSATVSSGKSAGC